MSAPAAVLVAAVVAVLATACAGRLFRARAEQPELPRVEYVRRSFRSALAGCADPATGAPAACVTIEIDSLDATRATAALARVLSQFVGATVLRPVTDAGAPPNVEVLRDELYEAYRALQQEQPDYRVPWRLERTVTVACNTERVQALVATERVSLGGHPVERVLYRTFDTRSGETIGLDALVAPERRAELLDVIAAHAQGARAQGLWERTPEAAAAEPVASDDVLVCPDALTLRWDGAQVVVPRDQIRALLRDDAP